MKETIYYVAMYLRLSRDDEDIDGNNKSESNSISSQREIIRSYIREYEDMDLYDVYVDDGFTGSNFERPDFKRMIGDIEAGMVNCVIVKDLSRFGRDYIEAGRYIQKTFPKQGVRFIAIIDNFDSLTADDSESSIVLPVKNFINDSYCRDISAKVRSQQQVKRTNGEFIGPFAAYGYRKDLRNKNRLVVDEYAAHVIKNIFQWKINGISAFTIAKKLNELGILSPMEYKKSLGENFKTGFTGSGTTKWQTVAVKRILTNEIYLGHMVQGKKVKVNYKIKKLLEKPESEWIKVENTHEPIIGIDDFYIVQNLLKVDVRASGNSENGSLFSGLLFCAHCKEQMVRRINRYHGKAYNSGELHSNGEAHSNGVEKVFYICSTYNRGEGCSRHSIPEEELKEVVFKECKIYANAFLEQAYLMEEISRKEADFEVITRYDAEMKRLRKEQDKYFNLCSGLYEDLRNGVLTKKEFDKLHKTYTGNCEQLDEALKNQEFLIKKLFKQGIASGSRLEKFRTCLELTEIDRHTLASLVHQIFINNDKRLEIDFNFQNEFEISLHANQTIVYEHGKKKAEERGMKYA